MNGGFFFYYKQIKRKYNYKHIYLIYLYIKKRKKGNFFLEKILGPWKYETLYPALLAEDN